MKATNKTSIIILVLMAMLGLFMWATSVEQSERIAEQGQHIEDLRGNLNGVRAGAATQAEMILSTRYCKEDPEKALCVQAGKTKELLSKPHNVGSEVRYPTFECSTTGQWIITYPNGEVSKPEGLCRTDPVTDPTPTPLKD